MLETNEIKPSDLHPNPWNTNRVDPENELKIEAAIKEFGFFKPVLARERADGKLEIIGGEHRVTIAAEMGYETVPVVNLGPISDDKAKKIGLIDNGRYGADDADALVTLINELGGPDEIIEYLPYTDADLTNIFSSIDIDLDDLDLDNLDEPAPVSTTEERPVKTHSIIQFKVSVEDAESLSEIIKKVQLEQGMTGSDEKTNAGDALVHLLITSQE